MSQPITFFVPGPLPNLNEIIGAAKGYHGRGFGYKTMKEEWTSLVVQAIRKCHIRPIKKAHFAFYWKEKNKRRDPDNFVAGQKFIFDGLVEAGVLVNDGWDQIMSIEHLWGVDKLEPGVVVSILEVSI